MKGIIFNGIELKTVDFTDSYKFLQDGVDGLFERIPITELDKRNIDLWCNEEGKFREDLKPTMVLMLKGTYKYDVLVGNILFTKTDGEGETISLTDDDIEFINKLFRTAHYAIDMESDALLPVLYY